MTDSVQAGVMAVIAIARRARFDIARQRGRRYRAGASGLATRRPSVRAALAIRRS